jgi:hypothetical protein
MLFEQMLFEQMLFEQMFEQMLFEQMLFVLTLIYKCCNNNSNITSYYSKFYGRKCHYDIGYYNTCCKAKRLKQLLLDPMWLKNGTIVVCSYAVRKNVDGLNVFPTNVTAHSKVLMPLFDL